MSITPAQGKAAGLELSARSRVLARIQYPLLTAFVLLYLVLGWRSRPPTMFAGVDELTYLTLSQSLENGSYREIFRVGTPHHIKFPPGYPAWLVAVRQVVGNRLDLIRGVNLALVAVSLVLLYHLARRLAGTGLALVLVFLLATNAALLYWGGSLMSEALFLLLTTAALGATLDSDRATGRLRYGAIGLALLAFLTRSAGIALVLALGPWLWARRHRAELTVYAVASALVVGGWFAYTATAPYPDYGLSYGSDLSRGGTRAETGLVVQLAHHVRDNAVAYATRDLPSSLSLPTIPGTTVDNLIWLGVSVVLLGAGLIVLWRTLCPAATYLILYASLLLIWPWPIGRYLVPVIPLTFLAFLLGARRMFQRLPGRTRNPAFAVLVALLTLGSLRDAITQDARTPRCDRASPNPDPRCYDEEGGSLLAATEYLHRYAPEGSVVLTTMGPSVYFLSGHPTEPALLMDRVPAGSAGRALRERKIEYVLLTSFRPYEQGPLARAVLASCRELQVEARFGPHALLLSTSEPTMGAAGGACAALTRFVRENSAETGPAYP